MSTSEPNAATTDSRLSLADLRPMITIHVRITLQELMFLLDTLPATQESIETYAEAMLEMAIATELVIRTNMVEPLGSPGAALEDPSFTLGEDAPVWPTAESHES